MPAEAEGPAGRGLRGFEVRPAPEHLAKSGAALARLAEVINTDGTDGQLKSVQIGHVVNNGMLAILLYGFPLLEFTQDLQLVDIARPETSLRFAVVANHPVAVQVQVVLSFLSDLVARQDHIAGVLAVEDPARIDDLDTAVADVDRLAQDEVVDDLGEGWETAARRVARRASDIGWRLRITFDPSLLPDHKAMVSRLPIVRKIYNDFTLVREAIDRTVATVAGREPQIIGRGGSERLRTFLQQQTGASAMRRYVNHAMRDAMVDGNGYLVFRRDEPFSFYNLRADETIAMGADKFGTLEGGRVVEITDNAFQITGLYQPGSSYGMSLLEPMAGSLAKLTALEDGAQLAGRMPSSLKTAENMRWAAAVVAMRDRAEAERDHQIRALMPVPLTELKSPSRDLYFPGYELY